MIQNLTTTLGPPRARLAPSVALITGLAMTGGCTSYERAPVPFRVPSLRVDAGYDIDEGLIAVDAGHASSESEAGAIPVRVRILYLEKSPAESSAYMSAAASEASAAFNLTGDEPIVETPMLTASLLYATGDDAILWIEQTRTIEDQFVAVDESVWLVPGATYRAGIGATAFIENYVDWLNEYPDRGPIPRRVGVALAPTASGSQSEPMGPAVAVEVTDIDPVHEAAIVQAFLESPDVVPSAPQARQNEDVRRESLAVGVTPAVGMPVVLQIDSPFANGSGGVCGIIVERLEPSEIEQSVDDARALVEEARVVRAGNAEPLTERTRMRMERAEALREFQARGGRPSLLLLAEEAGAPLAADLALVADESFLVTLSQAAFPPERSELAQPGITAFGESVATDSIAWELEAGAWRTLAQGALDETLDPELMGVLYRHGGVLARFPDTLLVALQTAAPSLEAFHEHLVIENRFGLEDAAPSARVRAHDWLVERGRAVEGYEPLAPREERRAALIAATEAATKPEGGEPRHGEPHQGEPLQVEDGQ